MKIFRDRRAVVRVAAVLAAVVLVVSACSSSDDGDGGSGETVPNVTAPAATAATVPAATTASTTTTSVVETASIVVPFSAGNGTGTVEMSGGGSAVVEWFGGLPGEVSLDLADADIGDPASVVEEVISFWFFQDEDSGDVPPSIFISDSGDITDSLGTTYVVEASGLPPAPGTEPAITTTSISPATTTTFPSPVSSTTTSPITTTTTSPPTTTSTTPPPPITTTSTTTTTSVVPVVLQVQVLNGSGVAGAAGRVTDRLAAENFVMLPAGNAPQRYSSSAVYYAEGWADKAREVLAAANIDEIEDITPIPQVFAGDAAVVVLLGTDTAPAIRRESGGLRPAQRNDVTLPLSDDIPRDRYVPGLAAINIYTPQTDNDEYTFGLTNVLQGWMKYVGNHANEDIIFGVDASSRGTREELLEGYRVIEGVLSDLGFTPQNVCGAPAGYSFTDLLKPTREWSEDRKTFSGDAIFTTDRLIELHGGERINTETNLDFYIGEAIQTAYDHLRIAELLDETESPQLILCWGLVSPAGEVPEFANGAWYAQLTPGIQPRESLLSQGTYHLKEISRNGNIAYLIVCHPTLGERHILLHWREAGYRAEGVTSSLIRQVSGCQASYEVETYIYEDTNGAEDTLRYSFGEQVFAASDLSSFPRR